jgi:hypothetical protein
MVSPKFRKLHIYIRDFMSKWSLFFSLLLLAPLSKRRIGLPASKT